MGSANDTTTDAGRRGEARAARFLEAQGLRVLARNYRCRGGEIDLVCRDGASTVFVEVRLRQSAAFGGAGASITPAKARRIVLAARHFLLAAGDSDGACRIDCVLIDGDTLRWIKNAIAAD